MNKPKIYADFKGQSVSLSNISRETGIPFGTLYKRYLRGTPLLKGLPKGSRRKCKVSEDNTAKTCGNCRKMLPLEAFHKKSNGVLGRFSNCKTCRNKISYQRQLEKELANGSRSVTNCSRCGLLMKRSMSTKQCRTCNSRD